MGRVTGADAACQSRGRILSACCHPQASPHRRMLSPFPALRRFLPLSKPWDVGFGESQGTLHCTHSPSWLVPVPWMLFPDTAGLLGQQEGWEGWHTAAPRCLLTLLPVLPASWFLRKQPSGRASSYLHPESSAQITASSIPPGTRVFLLTSSLGQQVLAGIVLCTQHFGEKSLWWGHGRAVRRWV